MKTSTFNFSETHQFSKIFNDFASNSPLLADFQVAPATPANYLKQIENRNFGTAERTLLHQALCQQYAHLPASPTEQIDLLLQDNTFTLVTGHQLNIFTGTLYFHYKIQTVIKAAKTLKETFPQYNFVPLYWQASEDHDFEEISYFYLFGKKYVWQTDQKGAVGRFNPSSLTQITEQIPEMPDLFKNAYTQNTTLANATRQIVHQLYGKQGLLVIDGDDKSLKTAFKPYMKTELLEQKSISPIEQQSKKLEQLHYPVQVHPRPINLFYLKEGLRERIVQEHDRYKVLHTDLEFSQTELLNELDQHPERFSPNVCLRPLYQEVILPNLSYTGGPGEFAYWLQLKTMFEAFKVPFPLLLPRNFALVVSRNAQQKMQKLGVSYSQMFLGIDKLKHSWLEQNISQPIDLQEEQELLKKAFERILQKAESVDKTLKDFVLANQQKNLQILEQIEAKIHKAQKHQFDTQLKQLTDLYEKLFPQGGLQERHDNFLSFYLNNPNFLEQTMACFNPFNFQFYILEEQ